MSTHWASSPCPSLPIGKSVPAAIPVVRASTSRLSADAQHDVIDELNENPRRHPKPPCEVSRAEGRLTKSRII